MLVGMVLGGFRGMVRRVEPMPMGHMSVVRRFLMIASFVMPGGFAMMICCVLVVLRGFFVVFCACVCTHTFPLSCGPTSFSRLLHRH
jgi:hypothetical protein